jgi:hypothetical protein
MTVTDLVLGKLPDHTSFSTIRSYFVCSKQVQLKKLVGVPPRPGWATVAGSAFHAATEQMDREGIPPSGALFDQHMNKIIVETKEALPEWPVEKWMTAGGRRGYGELHYRQLGPGWLERWKDFTRTTGWTIATEIGGGIEVELKPIINGKEVKMFVDRVMHHEEWGYAPLDLKSGQREKSPRQLWFYSRGLDIEYGLDVKWGSFWYAKDGMQFPYKMRGKRSVDKLVDDYLAATNANVYVPTPSDWCRVCDVNAYCAFYGGDKAEGNDPDWSLYDDGN